jgi:hypothetical protein
MSLPAPAMRSDFKWLGAVDFVSEPLKIAVFGTCGPSVITVARFAANKHALPEGPESAGGLMF